MTLERRATDRANPEINDHRARSVGTNVIATFVVTSFLLALVPLMLVVPTQEYPVEGAATIEEAISERVAAYLQLWSIILPALVAFFGFYRVRGDMRDAIAGSFVVAFLVVLVESVILNVGLFENAEGSLRGIVVGNFMTLVGTIVVFYFGSEAAIRVGGQYADAKAREVATRELGPTVREEGA